jgi:galactokinase
MDASAEILADDDTVARAVATFIEQFGSRPTFAAHAPGCVHLIGQQAGCNEGYLLPMAIDRRTVIVARENHSKRCRVAAADLGGEIANFMNDDSIAPGKVAWANHIKGVVAVFRTNGQPVPGFDAAVASALPTDAEMGNWSALTVATATLLELLTGIRIDPVRKVHWCQRAEQTFAGNPGGIVDPLVAVAGRRGQALFIDTRTLECHPVPLSGVDPAMGTGQRSPATVVITDSSLHLGSTRSIRQRECGEALTAVRAAKPAAAALRDVTLNELEQAAQRMSPVAMRRARHVINENQRVLMTARALAEGDLRTAGFLMNESHRSVRDDFEASRPEIDLLAALAWDFPGVYGSRLADGGNGEVQAACTVTLVEPRYAPALVDHLASEFNRQTGLTARCFVTAPSGGTGSIPLVH